MAHQQTQQTVSKVADLERRVEEAQYRARMRRQLAPAVNLDPVEADMESLEIPPLRVNTALTVSDIAGDDSQSDTSPLAALLETPRKLSRSPASECSVFYVL